MRTVRIGGEVVGDKVHVAEVENSTHSQTKRQIHKVKNCYMFIMIKSGVLHPEILSL